MKNIFNLHKISLLVAGLLMLAVITLSQSASAQTPCPLRGFTFSCYLGSLSLSTSQVQVNSGSLTVNVIPSSSFNFALGTEVMLEPVQGVGFGVGLLRLCSDRDGRSRSCQSLLNNPASMTIPFTNLNPFDIAALSGKTFVLWTANFVNFQHATAIGTVTFTTSPTGPIPPIPPFPPLPPVNPNAPVITGVNIARDIPVNTRVNGNIFFTDRNRDVFRVDLQAVSNFTSANWNPAVAGLNAGAIPFFITCNRVGTRFATDVVLTDAAGNTSRPVRLQFTCVGGETNAISDPASHISETSEAMSFDSPKPLNSPAALSLGSVSTKLSSNSLSFQLHSSGVREARVQVYSLSGNLLFASESTSGNGLSWNMLDTTGSRVANGVYLYVITVEGFDGKVVRSEIKKLSVLR